MSNNPHPPHSPSQHSFSRQGFQPLRNPSVKIMAPHDATTEIPLENVATNRSMLDGGNDLEKGSTAEKGHFFHRHAGRRKLAKLDSQGQPIGIGEDGEQDTLTRMGMIYSKILNFSIVTRYFLYVLPFALAIAIPILVGATVAKNAKIGGVRMVWFFTWIEIVWLSLWVSKIVVHFLPTVFQFFAGVVSSGTRKYALVIRALEIPLSLVGWAVTSLATFIPLMTLNPDKIREKDTDTKHWQDVIRLLLVAALVSTCILLAEKFLIQLISINYHRKQFNIKIKESKRNIYLLSLLYDASRNLFPMYCREFADEDYIIGDELGITGGKNHKRSGSATPMRLLQDVGRFGDKITSVFGNVAKEITGKQILNPNSAHSIVVEALERTRSSEALARRIWMSFVVEGRNELYQEDIIDVLGADHEAEAMEAFGAIDRDGNGDISLEEIIQTVTEMGRERKSIASSMHDVDQAIHVLDGLLATAVFIICIFIFVAFLNASFVTTLATAGTALLSLSFVFAATCQEVLGSCIFLFVKHPYDIGDRVDLGSDTLIVEHISLLFTVFRRTNNGKMVQIPNIVLNNLWVENVSRSKAMRESISIFCAFDTPFEDIKALKNEMLAFVTDKENSRDFQPEVEVDCISIAEMNKLELRIEIRHKGNTANGAVIGPRRSKFMCALVAALRKVPIYGPGGADAALGDEGHPTYSVAISMEQAQAQRNMFNEELAGKRMLAKQVGATPSSEETYGKTSGYDYGSSEYRGGDRLTHRSGGQSYSRDDGSTKGRLSTDRAEIDEVRGLLHKQSVSGKRRADPNSGRSQPPPPVPFLTADYATQQQAGSSSFAAASAAAVASNQLQTNAFAQQQQQQQQQQQYEDDDRLGPVGGGEHRPYSGV